MPRKKLAGLYRQESTGNWIINKRINGRRYHKSTGLRSRTAAERELKALIDRQPVKPAFGTEVPTFRDAAIRYLRTSRRVERQIKKDAIKLSKLYLHLADLPLSVIDYDRISGFVDQLKNRGRKGNTINGYLALVRLILRKAEREWKTDSGQFWLDRAPHIPLHKVTDARRAYPISWQEQRLLMPCLPDHLQRAILFILNTGLRNSEACSLKWSWFQDLEGTDLRFFVIPADQYKNGQPRVVILNSVAEKIVDFLSKNKETDFVFNYRGRPLRTMRNDGWLNAVSKAVDKYSDRFGHEAPEGFRRLRIHDLRHTVGRRLRAAGGGISEMDIAALLGHQSGSITRYYADAELQNLRHFLEMIQKPSWKESKQITAIK